MTYFSWASEFTIYFKDYSVYIYISMFRIMCKNEYIRFLMHFINKQANKQTNFPLFSFWCRMSTGSGFNDNDNFLIPIKGPRRARNHGRTFSTFSLSK